MVRIAMIGAGSLTFTRKLVTDCLAVSELRDSCFALMDMDRERLKYIGPAIERVIDKTKAPARTEVSKV